ncbi:MAG: branched-chain amino acid ABC transporter permease [Desulfobacterales bacterium]|jgi:branched-chain amino acid transport system permease protein|nr:branched-chain amino acid ABC transporter permease [Desulfobacterales bacterium]MDH3877179.1 branched-chain amino acid ABC transporter permease [Desulfobacterales bacterium]MDH4009794.1 branched-chain amino acid ABC transporter permease [Desulfobacterales bacterium]
MANAATESTIDKIDQTIEESFVQKAVRWLFSAGGITICLTILVAVVATIHKGPYILVNTFITGGMWALMAIGLALLFSVMNIAGFAHGEYFMAGSLTAYFVMQPISNYTLEHPESFMAYVGPMIAILAGTFMCAFLGILTERLVFKQLRMRNREGWLLNCFLITLGISVIFQNTHQLAFGANFKGILAYWDFPSVPIFGVYMSIDRICAFFIAILTMIGFYIFMMFSTSGKTIRAVSQDEDGARMVGISVDTVHVLTFALSCGLAGLAGASLLFMFPSYPTVGVMPLYNSWFIIILVGFGNVAGSIPGGFMIALFQVLTRSYLGEGWEAVVPVLLISLILIFKPSGIFATKVRTVWDE